MRSWHLAHVAMCAPLSGTGSTSILLRVGYWGSATIAASALLETTCFFENKELKDGSCECAALWSRHATLPHLLHKKGFSRVEEGLPNKPSQAQGCPPPLIFKNRCSSP